MHHVAALGSSRKSRRRDSLKDISPKQRPILGGFYGRELLSADLDDLEVEKILATKKLEDGRTLVKCRYKGYSPSFDRWVEK